MGDPVAWYACHDACHCRHHGRLVSDNQVSSENMPRGLLTPLLFQPLPLVICFAALFSDIKLSFSNISELLRIHTWASAPLPMLLWIWFSTVHIHTSPEPSRAELKRETNKNLQPIIAVIKPAATFFMNVQAIIYLCDSFAFNKRQHMTGHFHCEARTR